MMSDNNNPLKDKESNHKDDIFHSEYYYLVKRTKNEYIKKVLQSLYVRKNSILILVTLKIVITLQ